MREAYNFGKNGAADELKVPASPTKRDSTTFINQNALAITDKQMAELTFIVKSAALAAVRKNNLANKQAPKVVTLISAVKDALDKFFEDQVSLTGSVAVMQSVNRGRMDTYNANQTSIYA